MPSAPRKYENFVNTSRKPLNNRNSGCAASHPKTRVSPKYPVSYCSPNIKISPTISKEKDSLMPRETETPKKSLYSWKLKSRKKFLIFQESDLSYISGSNFSSSKNKKSYSVKISYISGNGTL